MKTTLHYSARMTLCVHALDITSQIDLGWKPLEETLEYIDCIFNNATMFHADCVDWVHIIDSTTGELIAECEPDPKPSDKNEYDPDWDYNEDMGFDPYEGGYTYDC